MRDAELHCFCLRWAAWHRAHGLIAPPMQKGILARLQPGKQRNAPVVWLSAEMSLFNLAVNSQPDDDTRRTFLIYYLHPTRSVKELAGACQLSDDAIYKRLRTFRKRAYRAAVRLDAVNRAARLQRPENEPLDLYQS
jgi:hypothetical protein